MQFVVLFFVSLPLYIIRFFICFFAIPLSCCIFISSKNPKDAIKKANADRITQKKAIHEDGFDIAPGSPVDCKKRNTPL